jgi:hypothetical protein
MTFQEYLNLKDSIPLLEGIDIDTKNRVVKFTDDNENFVDTSLINNPTTNINTISVFKRKASNLASVSDGNPLVYALKGINAWTISAEDREKIWARVDNILNKLSTNIDVLILAPSTNSLVEVFADRIQERFPNALLLNKCLMKRTKEEVYEAMSPWFGFSEDEIDSINMAFETMQHWFEAKKLPKNILNKIDTNIVKYNPDFKGAEIIVDKDVLIVDDVMSSGTSLGSCARVLAESYSPKSITNLVMFSKL